jgi:hypothetical protein
MNSELGMLLPFAFALVVVWSGTRIILARMQLPRDRHAGDEQSLSDLTRRIERIEDALDATTREVQRLVEAERFTAQLLHGRTVATNAEREGADSRAGHR